MSWARFPAAAGLARPLLPRPGKSLQMGRSVVDLYQDGLERPLRIPIPFAAGLRRLAHPLALLVVLGHLALLAGAWWMLRRLIPDAVTLSLFGHLHLVSGVHQRLIDRILVAGVLVPGVFLLEYLWMGWEDCSVRHLLVGRTASGRTDLVCFLAGLTPPMTLLSTLMSLGVVLMSGEWARQAIARATGLDLSVAAWPLAAQTAVLFVVYSLFDYFSHRLDHTRLFWPLHRFHHAADDFSVLTAARVHPAAFTALVGTTLPGILVGAAPEALADLALLVMTVRLVIHSRIESGFGWVGRWIVQSPSHHRLHHSLNRLPINLGLLPVWDRLFGTWRDAPSRPLPMGAPTPYRQGAWIGPDIWRDYQEFWTGAWRLLVGRRLSLPLIPPSLPRWGR